METHAWLDHVTGRWTVYSENKSAIRKYEKWLGAPSRRGRGDACAEWTDIPADMLRIARRRKSTMSPAAREVARDRALQRLKRPAPPVEKSGSSGR